MLGGSVYVAFIRFALSLAGTILLFSLLSEPRYGRRKTVTGYVCFGVVLIAIACAWYMIDLETCVRIVAFAMYICFAVFAFFMSRDPVYVTVYKLALTF